MRLINCLTHTKGPFAKQQFDLAPLAEDDHSPTIQDADLKVRGNGNSILRKALKRDERMHNSVRII